MNQATLNAGGSAFAAAVLVALAEAIASRFGVSISSIETAGAIPVLATIIHHYVPWMDTSKDKDSANG